MLSFSKKHPLDITKNKFRQDLINLVHKNGGHIGGSLSCIDIITSIYYSKYFNLSSDHFILSAGHWAAALYVVLASLKKFPKKLLETYGQLGSPLQGHVSTEVPGVEYSSGSLGQGLSFSAGLALGDKNSKIICLTSDGEHQEGQIWEAIAFAYKYKLKNLINIVNYNNYQIDGSINEIMPLRNLAQKYREFGWTVISINGHNFNDLHLAFRKAQLSTYPVCIIAKTVLGKGISFMENNFKYHDVKGLSDELYEKSLNETSTR
jgi:transketolase